MIRLVTIEKINSRPTGSDLIECELLQTSLPVSQVKCEISVEDLEKLPNGSYEAISYSWLDMEADVPLVINERELLHVNPSLIACLQHLLGKQDKLILWWDNICVKQTDPGELASQVTLMKDIFKHAKRTYIWLGENDEDLGLALQTLNEICPLDGSGSTSAEHRANIAKSLVREGFRAVGDSPGPARAFTKSLPGPWIVL